jgi:preprotein translocase subunit YajC
MYATVVDVDGDDVILEVAPGVEVRYMKRAIMEVVSSGEPVDETETDADDEAADVDHDADTDEAHTDSDWESFTSDDAAETGSSTGSTTASTTKDSRHPPRRLQPGRQ